MVGSNRVDRVRKLYEAFAQGDRAQAESLLADGFTFSSPVDVGLDRAGYFARCWPGSAGWAGCAGLGAPAPTALLAACQDQRRWQPDVS